MRKLKFTIITDVPTPYRAYFFNKTYEELRDRGIDFEVMFMAKTVPIRYWEVDTSKWKYKYRIAKGVHLHIGANSFHLNPGVIWELFIRPPTWVLIGGAWNMPTSFLSIFVARLFHKSSCNTILWSEANKYSMTHKKGFTASFRRLVANSVSMFAVPGQLATDTLLNEWGLKKKRHFLLPNLIDDKKYRNIDRNHGANDSFFRDLGSFISKDKDVVLIWPARLHETTKGIHNFLNTAKEILKNSHLKILIAGDGPDRDKLQKWISENLPDNVLLLGQKSEDEMLKLYSISDVLLLPSLRDPNPLSVIEGLWSSLPLLISSHCGNSIEAVKKECNGWVIDPLLPESIKTAVSELKSMTKNQLKTYGENSFRIAEEKYSSILSIKRFFEQLLMEKQQMETN